MNDLLIFSFLGFQAQASGVLAVLVLGVVLSCMLLRR